MKSVQNLQSLSRVFLSVLIDIISLSLVCKILQSRVFVQTVLCWNMNHISYRNMFYMLNMHLWLKIRLKYSWKTQKNLKIFMRNSKMAKYLFTAKNGRNMYLNIFYLNKYFGLPCQLRSIALDKFYCVLLYFLIVLFGTYQYFSSFLLIYRQWFVIIVVRTNTTPKIATKSTMVTICSR